MFQKSKKEKPKRLRITLIEDQGSVWGAKLGISAIRFDTHFFRCSFLKGLNFMKRTATMK